MVNLPCLMVSCTNFPRPTCSYTECQLSFQTGSMPYEENYCQLQLLFVFDCYWPSFYSKKTVFQWTLSLVSSVGLVGMQCFSHSIWFAGFLSRTLLDFRYFWNPARFWSLIQSIVLKLPVTADSVLLYLPTSYSDHTLSLSSGLYILPSVFCRLSLSAAAASLANYLFWLCNTHAVPWIPPHVPLPTLPPEITSIWAPLAPPCGWFWFLPCACRSCMLPVLIHLISVFTLHRQILICSPSLQEYLLKYFLPIPDIPRMFSACGISIHFCFNCCCISESCSSNFIIWLTNHLTACFLDWIPSSLQGRTSNDP